VRHRAALLAGALSASALLTVCIGVAPAGAGGTTPSSGITSAAHGAVMPEFSVTVADSFGTMDGALFRISDGWRVVPSYLQPTQVQWSSPGICGISALTDGNGQPIATAQIVDCSFKRTTAGFYNLRLATESTSVPSPITVTFKADVFTAPSIGTSSTWTVGTVNNTDGGIPAPLIFNLVDLAVMPEAQYISCEQGVPMESKPLVPSGLTGTVSYSLLDDVPSGIVFDPLTGVVSGAPIAEVPPQTVRIDVSSANTAGSVIATVGLNVPDPSRATTTTTTTTTEPSTTTEPRTTTTLPAAPTTTRPQTPALPATGLDVLPFLAGGGLLVCVGTGLLIATRRAQHQ
jgi:hypothetical protein